MGKIALLVSKEEMIHQAHNILQEKHYDIDEMRVISSGNAVAEARNCIAGGTSIIIARGLQASMIKQYTETPVVEIVLTAQEMALLVMRAKQIVKKERPVIAVVGFENMFCDMSYFDTIYDIELRTYFAPDGAGLKQTVEKAIEEKADLIIGGDTAVTVASEHKTPSLFLSTTEDSLKNAFLMAERMDYAMSIEKKNTAQLETLLDSSFNGVIRMDTDGTITTANPFMEEITGREEKELAGQKISDVFPDVDEKLIRQVVDTGRGYSLFLSVKHVSVYAIMDPVMVDQKAVGLILNCHKVKKNPSVRQEKKISSGEENTYGVRPLVQFQDILQASPSMKECIRLARLYSMSERPVLIMGEAGTEKLMTAQSIHNSSIHSRGVFLDVPCDGLSDGEQQESIFGEKGTAIQAEGGSLLIQDVDKLTASNQYRLYQLIRYHVCGGSDMTGRRKVNVRVMATSGQELAALAEQGDFREDLYYLLSGLVLRIPPLRERREDLETKLSECIKDNCENYSRYHVLTKGAWSILMDYPWYGNLFQIENFCEQLILTAQKRSIDEIRVREVLKQLYGGAPAKNTEQEERQNMTVKEAMIRKTLLENDGNRQKTAESLGMSKATLWRQMKKYEII